MAECAKHLFIAWLADMRVQAQTENKVWARSLSENFKTEAAAVLKFEAADTKILN